MNEAAPRVLDLLTYIEQVEKLKTKPAFSVPTEYFYAYQHELRGLPELQFNLQADGGRRVAACTQVTGDSCTRDR